MNPGPAEPEADMLPSEPTRRAHIYIYIYLKRSEKIPGAPTKRWVDLANWALRTSPKFTTGVKYQFHQGFWPDQRSGSSNHPSPPTESYGWFISIRAIPVKHDESTSEDYVVLHLAYCRSLLTHTWSSIKRQVINTISLLTVRYPSLGTLKFLSKVFVISWVIKVKFLE